MRGFPNPSPPLSAVSRLVVRRNLPILCVEAPHCPNCGWLLLLDADEPDRVVWYCVKCVATISERERLERVRRRRQAVGVIFLFIVSAVSSMLLGLLL